MPERTKILILPSWYARPDAPTSGSFFKEQAELMMPDFDVKVMVADKRWISWRRYYYERLRPHPRRFLPFFLNIPPTLYFEYDFLGRFSDEKNFAIMQDCYGSMLERLIREGWKPDAIHAHCAFQGGLLAQYLSARFGIPYIVTEHMNPFVLHTYTPFMKNQVVHCLENANHVLAVSNHQKQHILMNQIRCNPQVVGNLVNERLFTLASAPQDVFTIAFIAYYPNFIKDFDTFFHALSLIKDKGLRVKLIGGGELSGEMATGYVEGLISRYGLEDIVKRIPRASRTEMNEHFAQSHILVSSSIAESFGVAICEAMLCGRPVVSTKNGGCDDFLIEGVNGFTVPIKDPEMLAEKILFIKNNYSTFNPQIIRESIIHKFGTKAFKQRISAIYRQIIINA